MNPRFQVLSVQRGDPDAADDDVHAAGALDGLHLVRHRHGRAAQVRDRGRPHVPG